MMLLRGGAWCVDGVEMAAVDMMPVVGGHLMPAVAVLTMPVASEREIGVRHLEETLPRLVSSDSQC